MADNQYPRLTVAMTVRNGAKTIRQAIDSLIIQHYPNLEVVIFDGASDDDTLEILKSYGSFITTLKSEKDKGTADGLNKAVKLTTGDYVGFLNADDELEPGALWAVANAITQSPDAEVITFGMLYKNAQGRVTGYYADKRQLEMTLAHVLTENPTFLLSRFFRKDLMAVLGEFTDDRNSWFHCNDREWLARLALRGCRNVIIPKALYTYTFHSASLTSNPANYGRCMVENSMIADHLLTKPLTWEQETVVKNWDRRQLVFGFWIVLSQQDFTQAKSFYKMGYRKYGVSFIAVGILLLIEKVTKRIVLKLSGKIDNGAFVKAN